MGKRHRKHRNTKGKHVKQNHTKGQHAKVNRTGTTSDSMSTTEAVEASNACPRGSCTRLALLVGLRGRFGGGGGGGRLCARCLGRLADWLVGVDILVEEEEVVPPLEVFHAHVLGVVCVYMSVCVIVCVCVCVCVPLGIARSPG
jgi:hypothetical protein